MTLIQKIIVFFIILHIFSATALPQADAPKAGTMQYISMPLLVVIYSNSAGKTISSDEISKIKSSIEVARNFIWRNSSSQLNLSLTYLTIDAAKSVTFFSTDGLPEKKKVEEDLIARGILEAQYSMITVVFRPPFGGRDFGGGKIFSGKGYAVVRFPGAGDVIYPTDKDTIDGSFVHSFLNVIGQTVRYCYRQSRVTSFPESDQRESLADNTDSFFSRQADTWRNFRDYFAIHPFFGKVKTTRDSDEDGLPDDDVRVPLDEIRFKSDTTKKDTDADGLSDIKEFTAGIYRSSRPDTPDTDHDGIIDGVDPLPLHAIKNKIPFFTPQFEHSWLTWFQITNQLDFSPENFFVDIPLQPKIFINWDDDFLYFGCEMNVPVRLHLDLDLNNDGWLHGKDNYQLVADPFADRFMEMHALDASARIREMSNKPAIWDDSPQFLAHFERILDNGDVQLVTESLDGNYIIKIKIANNPKANFHLKKNNEIGVRIWFDAPALSENDARASVFELYRFFTITLK